MRRRRFLPAVLWFALVIPACAGRTTRLAPASAYSPGTRPLSPLRTPPKATGPLQISIAYPREDHRTSEHDSVFIYMTASERIQSRDSAFIFGSVGRGDARLAINGVDVPVYPTGAWLAWLPLPDDTIGLFHLVASTATARHDPGVPAARYDPGAPAAGYQSGAPAAGCKAGAASQ